MKILGLLLILFPLMVSASFTGTGFGESAKEAKHEALSDLSQSIKAEVRSRFSTYKAEDHNSTTSKSDSHIVVTSNLPIIGAEFELFDNSELVEALVSLSPKKVKKLYKSKLQNLSKELQTLKRKVSESKNNLHKEQLLSMMLEALNAFNRYYSVGVIVDVKEIQRPDITKASIEHELLKLHHNMDSMALGAKHLAKAFEGYKNIYLYPPKVDNSHEITPFSKTFSLHVKPHIRSTTDLNSADYRLVGSYVYSERGAIVSYDLIDSSTHERRVSKTITLNPKAYRDLRIRPANVSFDKLLHKGIAVSSALKASLATNKGTEELLFSKGEEIELLIKLNKMSYYYLIGYTQTEDAKLAYLLELNEAPGDERFKGFVNADDANRWISLGAFNVEAPFGIESLQLIASDKKIKKLPTYHYDQKSSFYIIGKNPQEGLVKTRALIRKKSNKQEISEAVLLFTTSK